MSNRQSDQEVGELPLFASGAQIVSISKPHTDLVGILSIETEQGDINFFVNEDLALLILNALQVFLED